MELKNDLSRVDIAVEELMRFDSPLQLFRRWVLQDLVYDGLDLKQGTEVALIFGAANRDPRVFENANTLNLRRSPNPHISFGGGIHFCLGAPLARMELNIAYASLLQQFPNIKLATEPHFHPTYVIRGLDALYVTL